MDDNYSNSFHSRHARVFISALFSDLPSRFILADIFSVANNHKLVLAAFILHSTDRLSAPLYSAYISKRV